MARLKTRNQLLRNKPILFGPHGDIVASQMYEGANPYSDMQRSTIIYNSYSHDWKDNVNEWDMTQLLNSARYLYSNVGAIKQAIFEIAAYSVGEAWLPQYTGLDEAWGAKATEWLGNWFNICDVRGNDRDFVSDLFLASVAMDRDGDTLLVLTYANDGKYPMVQFFPSHRIGSRQVWGGVLPSGPFKGYSIIAGSIVNSIGRVIGYNILGEDAGGKDDTQVSVFDSMLVYDNPYIDAVRGVTSLANAINDWKDYRDIRDYEKRGIKAASSVAFIEFNEQGGVDPADQINDITAESNGLYSEYLDGGSIRYMKSNSGNELKPFVSDRPGSNTNDFLKNHVMRNAFASLEWPIELTWDLSSLGSNNTRAILVKAQRKINKRQATLYKVWKRAVTYGLAKAIKLGFLPKVQGWNSFEPTFPKELSVDVGRDIKAEIELYKMGGTNLSDMYGKTGFDWKIKIDQKIKERKYLLEACEREGVNPNDIQMLTPNGNNTTTGAEPVEQTKDNEEST